MAGLTAGTSNAGTWPKAANGVTRTGPGRVTPARTTNHGEPVAAVPNHSLTLAALEPDDVVRLRLDVLAARITQIHALERRDRPAAELAARRMDHALERWAQIANRKTVRPGAGSTP